MIIAVGLTSEHLVLDSELSTCSNQNSIEIIQKFCVTTFNFEILITPSDQIEELL